jgi:hypothetical protein
MGKQKTVLYRAVIPNNHQPPNTMTNVHPLIQAAIAPMAPASALTEYHAALKSFDWNYDFSDDQQRWANGSNALARLRKMQAELDTTGEIWMSYPGAQGHGAPAPRV